eukprot:scaffold128338_cov48-Phaeocystis_antarctica.AAC.1
MSLWWYTALRPSNYNIPGRPNTAAACEPLGGGKMSGSANCPRFPPLALPSANRPRFLLALQESAGEGSCRGTEQRRLSRSAAVGGRCGRGASGGACKESRWHAHGRRQASAPDVHE